MMKYLAVLMLLPCLCFAQSDTSLVHCYNPETVHPPKGYSQVAEINLGTCRMLIMSGQIALDKAGNLVGKENLKKQTEQVFENIKNLVEARGGTMADVVKLNYFVLDATQVQTIRNVRDKFVNTKNPPASTLVQVLMLFRPDLLIEVEATAIIPNRA